MEQKSEHHYLSFKMRFNYFNTAMEHCNIAIHKAFVATIDL